MVNSRRIGAVVLMTLAMNPMDAAGATEAQAGRALLQQVPRILPVIRTWLLTTPSVIRPEIPEPRSILEDLEWQREAPTEPEPPIRLADVIWGRGTGGVPDPSPGIEVDPTLLSRIRDIGQRPPPDDSREAKPATSDGVRVGDNANGGEEVARTQPDANPPSEYGETAASVSDAEARKTPDPQIVAFPVGNGTITGNFRLQGVNVEQALLVGTPTDIIDVLASGEVLGIGAGTSPFTMDLIEQRLNSEAVEGLPEYLYQVPPGVVAVVTDTEEDFVRLFEALKSPVLRTTTQYPKGQFKVGSSQCRPEQRCTPTGAVSLGSDGQASFSAGCAGGVSVEVSTTGKVKFTVFGVSAEFSVLAE